MKPTVKFEQVLTGLFAFLLMIGVNYKEKENL
jgi:hypothetical protein